MNQRWTLHVRNFGPIQSADIDMHPFMMFVGPNNSGKSYLSTLIWGLLTQGKILLVDSTSENPAYKACHDWLRQEEKQAMEHSLGNESTEGEQYVSHIGQSETQLFIDWFNELLNVQKKIFLRALFNSDSVDAEWISISNYDRSKPVSIKWQLVPQNIDKISLSSGEFGLYFSQEKKGTSDLGFPLRYILLHMMTGDIGNTVDSMVGLGGRYFQSSGGASLYLPSARTGFMLNFRSLASSTIGQGFSLQDRPKDLHTTPTINFLQGLIELPQKEKGKYYKDIVCWLENNVINGAFVRSDDILPDFNYTPKESNQELALHVCSSLVTG